MHESLKEDDSPAKYLKVKKFQHTTVNPTTGENVVHAQECVMRPDSVGVLIHRPRDQKFIWVEQFRIGPGTKEPGQPNTIEPVAGMVDKEGDPREAAEREVWEETHLAPLTLEHVMSFYMCPGIINERMHLYYATIDAAHVDEIGGLAEENEFIKIHVWDAYQTEEAMQSGRMNNAHALLLWQWAKLKGLVPELTSVKALEQKPKEYYATVPSSK